MATAHLTDTEFNLQWVFEQLCNVDTGSTDPDAAPDALARSKSSSSASGSSCDRVLSIGHLRHIFSTFLRVHLSDDELEEVLIMLDENQDGKVTQDDFMHSMLITPQSAFDTRYALNLPWAALDSSTKDGLLTEEDSHAARQTLGKMWGVDNEAEWNAVVREIGKTPNDKVPQLYAATAAAAAAAAAAETAPSSPTLSERGGGGHSSQPSSSTPLSPPRKPGMHLDRDHFRRIVAALAVPGSGEIGLSPSLIKQPSHVQAPSFTQMHAAALSQQQQQQHSTHARHSQHSSLSYPHSSGGGGAFSSTVDSPGGPGPALSIHFSPASSPASPPAASAHTLQPPALSLDALQPLDSPVAPANKPAAAPLAALTPSLSHAAAGVPQPPHTTRPSVARTPSKPAVDAPPPAPGSQSTRNRRVVASGSKQSKT